MPIPIISKRAKVAGRIVLPAVGKCPCGTEVYLHDPLNNRCSGCGSWYNSSGQHVRPSWEFNDDGSLKDPCYDA
jgi:hypothetical protein